MDWINDFRFWQVDYQHPRVLPSSRPRIHSGIYAVYRTVRARFEKAFERVLREGDAQLLIEHEVAVVGHSLGAALASLLTMELRAHQLASVEASPDMTPIPTTMPTLPRFPSAMRLALYSFAQPALGNRALVDFFDTTMPGETAAGIAVPPLSLPRVHRVVGKHDIVPLLPPVQLGYAHFTSGQLFWVDWVGDGRDRPARTFQCMSNVGDAAETAGIVDSAAVHNRLFHTIQDAQDHVRASLLASDSAIASEAMAADACRFHGFTRYGHVSYYWNFDSVRDRCRMLVR